MAYEGKFEDKDVLVKIFKKKMKISFDAESAALTKLNGGRNVPSLSASLKVKNHDECNVHEMALVVTPVGNPVKSYCCNTGKLVFGKHFGELVDALKLAHEHDIIHCDVKPGNIFLTDDDVILLNDWGSSKITGPGSSEAWEGTIGFSVSPQEMLAHPNWSGEIRDLVALVRTAYVLMTKRMPPDSEMASITFWSEVFSDKKIWKHGLEMAMTRNYAELKSWLESLI